MKSAIVIGMMVAVGICSAPLSAQATGDQHLPRLAELVTMKESLSAVSAGIISSLTPDERARLGQFDTVADADDDSKSPCFGTATLSYSQHQKGKTTAHLCKNGLQLMLDYMMMSALYPAVAEKIPADHIIKWGEPPLSYMKLIVTASTKNRDREGHLQFPLTKCDAFSFLRAYVSTKTELDCSDASTTEDRKFIVDIANSSSLMKRATPLGQAFKENDPNADAAVSLVKASIITSLLYVLSHEIAHNICSGSDAACSDESHIDGMAIDLIIRNRDEPIGVLIMPSIQSIILFTSLFNDSKLAYEKSMDEMMISKEVDHRRNLAACKAVSVIEGFVKSHRDTMARLEELAKGDPMLTMVIGDRFGAMRMMYSFQCAIAAGPR